MVVRLLRSCSPHTVWWALDPLQTLASINHNNYCLEQSLTNLLEALMSWKRLNSWVGFWKDCVVWCCVKGKGDHSGEKSGLVSHIPSLCSLVRMYPPELIHAALRSTSDDGLSLWRNCKLPTKHESRHLKAASGSTFHGTTSKWLWKAYHCPASWG